MSAQTERNSLLAANECAERIGLTVRALRLYEERGLIKPRRTLKGWRLYGADEIARLHEVLALKQLGLSLKRIVELLQGKAVDLERILAVQQTALSEQRNRVDRSLALVSAARAKLAAGGSLSGDELIKLAKESNMTEASTDAVAWRRYEQARPRTESKVARAVFASYEGFYRHPSGLVIAIEQEDGRLFVQLSGQPRIEMFPESETKFFLKVVPAQISFVSGQKGPASGLVLHQGGHDSAAPRIAADEAKRVSDELDSRIRNKTPQTNSESTLRSIIMAQQGGEPCLERMSEELAAAVREQFPVLSAELAAKGALRSLAFRSVGPGGADIYDAEFAGGKMEWGIGLASDGKVHTLWMSPGS